jgi:ribose transport system ATP-binding protein
VATREHFGEDEAVTLMTGRTIDRMYPDKPVVADDAEVVLETEDLGDDLLDGVSFKLRRGEILGVGGLAGQGQPELFMSLFGARRSVRGRVLVRGKRARLRRPKDAIRHGMAIALVPEDRKTEGLMLPMSVRDNLTLAVLDSVSTGGVIRPRREKATVATAIERLRIKTRDAATQQVGTLSGGNQQKVLIGRWLLTQPDVLLLFDITRGVDVGTKHDIYELVVQLAAEGKALLYYSSETEEIAQLCNRVLVMREGRIVAELDGADTDAEAIVAAAVREGPA